MKFIKQIPNFLTSLNLICGFLSIILASNSQSLIYAPYLIFIAVFFDFADGFAARLLKINSEIGKQLDSLADGVSFGIAPGIIGFQLMLLGLHTNITAINVSDAFFLVTAVFIPVFSVLRLAKFNIDYRQSTEFIGLPTPASAVFISSLALIAFNSDNGFVRDFILMPGLLAIIFIIDSLLMISNLRLFALKFKSLSFSENFIQYLFLGISAIMFILFRFYALPLIIILYILLSLVEYIQSKPLAK
jgi:CDP-diacylglycerol--serine O-phosphatidyltransferase